MLKKITISLLFIIMSISALSISDAVAQGPEDYDERFPFIMPFWQGGSSFQDYFIGHPLHGWGCNLYAEPGVYTDCQDPDKNFDGPTIGANGCAITSLTMLFWNHGINSVPGSFEYIDPGTLNNWLVDNNGYRASTQNGITTHGLIWEVPTSKFTQPVEWLTIIYDIDSGVEFVTTPGFHFLVPNYCCNDECTELSAGCQRVAFDSSRFGDLLYKDTKNHIPDVMQISHWSKKYNTWSSHFTVIDGYDKAYSAYRDADPGRSYVWPAAVYNKVYPPKQDGSATYRFLSLRRFTDAYSLKASVDASDLSVSAHSPVEMLMIDPLGRRTGYDPATGTKLVENPMSDYSVEQPISSLDPADPPGEPYKQLVIVYPVEGNYILQIFGTGDGPYTIDLKSTTFDGTANLDTSFTGMATPSLLQTYRITYSSTGQASLSQTNQAPIANAGANQTGEQSYMIVLDGSASHDPDGDPMTYT